MPSIGLATSSQPQQNAPGPRASGALLLCGARSRRANQSTQDARAPRHGASTHRGAEPRRNRPQSAPDAARLDHAPPILRRPGTASTSTDQPPPRSSPHRPGRPSRSTSPARQRPGRRPRPERPYILGIFQLGPFFQRTRKPAMMRTRTTPKFFTARFFSEVEKSL